MLPARGGEAGFGAPLLVVPPKHSTPKEADPSPQRERELASADDTYDVDDDESEPPLVIDMSVRGEDQQEAAQGKDWTTMVNGRAARPKFKLGSLVDQPSASTYLAITAPRTITRP
ncbi:hypothetical protein GWK47_046006 [Chionoecetes opilio]|uniref:Uncharacterized protein n=1 Tax=Chionoecetes opilio TaxID=41210 RepID=A0A8J4YDF3_CHIOP|nr:hypothetical protein GWK47_046006 [Chionoecetes opilio]